MHPELKMTRQVYDQICNTIGRRPPESGGILGSSDGGKTIDRFYFDATAKVTGGTYSPDTEVINRVLAHWDIQDILLVGFVHSHPKGYAKPSEGDYRYQAALQQVDGRPGADVAGFAEIGAGHGVGIGSQGGRDLLFQLSCALFGRVCHDRVLLFGMSIVKLPAPENDCELYKAEYF